MPNTQHVETYRGWTLVVFLPLVVIWLTPTHWPSWAFMWLFSFAIYFGCKWLTWRRTPMPGAPTWQHVAYLLAWPGMDPERFLANNLTVNRPTINEWLFAGFKFLLGVVFFWGVARLVPSQYPIIVGWIGLVGLAFLLHFGLFHLLSCFWRSIGIDARPLMNHPWLADSVSDFWSKRWNIAFRDLTHRFLFRPLTRWWGAKPAIIGGFLFSGLVHDVVISMSAGGGYGGPTVFFVVQGVALLFERSSTARSIGLGHGWRGWLFTMIVVLAPAYWLFHPLYIGEITIPMMVAMAAIP